MVGNGSGRRKCGGCFENLVVAPEKIFDCRVGVGKMMLRMILTFTLLAAQGMSIILRSSVIG